MNETNNNDKERTDNGDGEEERVSLSKPSHQLTTSTSELHKNKTEHFDTATRPPESLSSSSKLHPPLPRMNSGSRRPVSTVEETDFVTDIPTCMTVSTPEVFFSDGKNLM